MCAYIYATKQVGKTNESTCPHKNVREGSKRKETKMSLFFFQYLYGFTIHLDIIDAEMVYIKFTKM